MGSSTTIGRSAWASADWPILNAAEKRHIRAVLARLKWLGEQATHLPDGRRTYQLDEFEALEWLCGLAFNALENRDGGNAQ